MNSAQKASQRFYRFDTRNHGFDFDLGGCEAYSSLPPCFSRYCCAVEKNGCPRSFLLTIVWEVRIKSGKKFVQMIARLMKNIGAAVVSEPGIEVAKDITEHPMRRIDLVKTRILHEARPVVDHKPQRINPDSFVSTTQGHLGTWRNQKCLLQIVFL